MKPSLIPNGKRRISQQPPQPPRKNPPTQIILTKDDQKVYGDRFPSGFRKIKLLGKGGCALVWLAFDPHSSQQVAIKQASKTHSPGSVQSCKRQIFFGKLLKQIQHPAISNISRLLAHKSDRHDIWAIFQLGGSSLGKSLFQIKGEFVRSQRIYNIQHLPLYSSLISDLQILKSILTDILNVLDLFAQLNLVHSDLKPDNILVQEKTLDVKIIDLGSAFSFEGNGSITTATPEYMPPQALNIAHSPGDHIRLLAEFSQP